MIVVIMIISDDCCLVGLFYSSSPAPRLCEILLSPSILVSGVFNISHFDSLLCNFWVNWNQTLEKWCFWGLIQTVLVHDLVNTWHYIQFILVHDLVNTWHYIQFILVHNLVNTWHYIQFILGWNLKNLLQMMLLAEDHTSCSIQTMLHHWLSSQCCKLHHIASSLIYTFVVSVLINDNTQSNRWGFINFTDLFYPPPQATKKAVRMNNISNGW
jgi:hypothetical protein